jgi:hypothetical protein
MATKKIAREAEGDVDSLVPDTQVCKEFSVTLMCLWRWTNDEKLGFPPAIKIHSRNYRSRVALEAFKARLINDAIRSRGNNL